MTVERRSITNHGQWLQWRSHDITASDVAPVMGLHPDRTIAKVHAEKTGLIMPEPDSDFLQFRLALEAAAIDWTQRKRPTWDIRRGGVYVTDTDLRLGATPDAVILDPDHAGIGVGECKSVIRYIYERDWTDLEGDECIAPIWHQLQTLTNMMLLQATWGVIIALILDGGGSGALRFCPVERNEEVESKIRDAVGRYWAMSDSGHQPPLNYQLDHDVIVRLYPEARIKNPPLDLSGDNRLPELLAERAEEKLVIKNAEKAVDQYDAEIKDRLGAHELATLPGWRISWKEQHRPERVQPEWRGRVLRVTATKGGRESD